MYATVIVAHPRPRSLNHALAAAAEAGLREAGFEPRLHDLYAEGFEPRLQPEELGNDHFADELAARHARELRQAERLVIVHPVWFFQVPAVLKGWVDRVLREEVAFRLTDAGVEGLLQVRRALVVTTGNAAPEYEVEVLGDPLTTFWRRCALEPAGVATVERLALAPVRGSSAATRAAWLRQVARLAGRPER